MGDRLNQRPKITKRRCIDSCNTDQLKEMSVALVEPTVQEEGVGALVNALPNTSAF